MKLLQLGLKSWTGLNLAGTIYLFWSAWPGWLANLSNEQVKLVLGWPISSAARCAYGATTSCELHDHDSSRVKMYYIISGRSFRHCLGTFSGAAAEIVSPPNDLEPITASKLLANIHLLPISERNKRNLVEAVVARLETRYAQYRSIDIALLLKRGEIEFDDKALMVHAMSMPEQLAQSQDPQFWVLLESALSTEHGDTYTDIIVHRFSKYLKVA